MSSLSLLAAVIMIEASPVMSYLRVDRYGGRVGDLVPELVASGLLMAGICVASTIVPLRLALQRIEKMEW